MKQSPEFVKAQHNMQAGVITADGFLGTDKRNIAEIIEADEERCSAIGLDLDDAAARLRNLLELGRKGLGEPTTVEDHWLVTVSEARGHLASPFEDGVFRKVNAMIEYVPYGKQTGETLLVSDLSLHLIEKYHFLQGKGASFRVEPEQIKRVLGP